jgi:hypothetical protein
LAPWEYAKYKAWFDGEYSKIALPADCREILPPTTRLSNLFSTVWTLEWTLGFTDHKYLRVQEHFEKIRGLVGLSQRKAFAFHYGALVAVAADGTPERAASDPVDLRIDTSYGAAHMHFGNPEPHIAQANVEGLDMEKLELFAFVRAVLDHRKTGKTLDKLLKFRIK